MIYLAKLNYFIVSSYIFSVKCLVLKVKKSLYNKNVIVENSAICQTNERAARVTVNDGSHGNILIIILEFDLKWIVILMSVCILKNKIG